jgi:hypothetical protein
MPSLAAILDADAADSTIAATVVATAEQYPGIKTDAGSAVDAVESVVVVSGDTATATDAAVEVRPFIQDIGDEQAFGVEDIPTVASSSTDTDSALDDQVVEASFTSADTAASTEDQLVAPDATVSDNDVAAADESDAFVFEPFSGSDTANAVDAGSVGANSSDAETAVFGEGQSIQQLSTTSSDTGVADDVGTVTASVPSSGDTGTAVEDGGAEFFLSSDDVATGADGANPANADFTKADTGGAVEATSIAAVVASSADAVQWSELSAAFRFIVNKYLVSSRQ